LNDLQIFKNEKFGDIRIIIEDGRTLFNAVDVASELGYTNTSKAISDHCRCITKRNVPHPQSKTKQLEMNFITESDLYRLILSSELPTAIDFEAWVFEEVLPSIRQNGGYIANQENLSDTEILAKAVLLAQNVIAQKDKLIQVMQPKAEYFDNLVERNLLTNFRDTAKELHIKEKDFISFLLEHNYIYRDLKEKLHAYSEFTQSGKGLFDVKEFAKGNYVGVQTLITPKGRETFRLLIQGI
jgi:prophage antirepressor-like protein